jgi:hypothetical protein
LKTEQAELMKQLKDVMQQMQTPDSPNVGSAREVLPPGLSTRQIPSMARNSELPPATRNAPPNIPATQSPALVPPMYSGVAPLPAGPYLTGGPAPFPTPMGIPDATPWLDQDRSWETSTWGPRLPKELTEVKQTVESLRKEVADLKDTIKALETQIQLLSRNILLSEKVRENGNAN